MLLLTEFLCVAAPYPISEYAFTHRPLSVGGNAVELEDRAIGCSLYDSRLHCSVAIFFCPVLHFRGFDVTSERGLLFLRCLTYCVLLKYDQSYVRVILVFSGWHFILLYSTDTPFHAILPVIGTHIVHLLTPFTPESDQCQISPPAPPEILHHTVRRAWLFIVYWDERWL